jgi:hypothetical protein
MDLPSDSDDAPELPIGIGLTADQYDEIALSLIKADLWAKESELMNTKWWDYRRLHPVEATYVFAYTYIEQFALRNRHRVDISRAPYIKPLKGKDPLLDNMKQINSLVKARQFADEYGMPYAFHIKHALKFADERDWVYLPRPSQLYSSKKSADETTMRYEVVNAWQIEKSRSIQYSRDDYFKIENFEGTDLQLEHQKNLIKQLRDRPFNRSLIGAEMVFGARVLDNKLYRLGLGEDQYASMINTARRQLYPDVEKSASID